MRALPEQFTAEEKQKWENGLIMLYKAIEANPIESQAHQDSKKKLHDFSMTLHRKIHNFKRPPQSQGQAQVANQGQSLQAQQQPDGSIKQEPAQQARPQSQPHKPNEAMFKHINEFPYMLPPHITAGSPEALRFISDAKNRYGKALLAAESSNAQLKNLDKFQRERAEQGNPLNQDELGEFNRKKESFQKNYADARKYIEDFRRSQEKLKADRAGAAQQLGINNVVPAPARPTLNLQQQAPNTAQQNTQAVNAAIEAARNQGINAARPVQGNPEPMPGGSGGHANLTQGPGNQGAGIKVEPNSQPQINTAIATAPHMQQQRPSQNSPHSGIPSSATSVGPPRPLTHQAAVAQANRTYSSGQATGTPNVMASHSHPSVPRESGNPVGGNRMPIPKQLPPGAIGTPQPVPMQPSRPTMSGGPNNAGSGSMSQPVLQKTPAFNLEGEGERVMNKKKLDELVRQVTGGGEGLDGGEGLTPEVEDVSSRISSPLSTKGLLYTHQFCH